MPAGSRTTRCSSAPSSPYRLPVSASQPIRILLVEDNDVFRQALELLLGMQAGLEVVGAVAEGTAVVAACQRLDPDVCVMDFRLPGMDGVEATTALRQACPRVAVVCLTASASDRELQALAQAGAVSCLRKDQELDEIVAAIRLAGVPA
jgi:two-component system, NarL family, response regulator DesR